MTTSAGDSNARVDRLFGAHRGLVFVMEIGVAASGSAVVSAVGSAVGNAFAGPYGDRLIPAVSGPVLFLAGLIWVELLQSGWITGPTGSTRYRAATWLLASVATWVIVTVVVARMLHDAEHPLRAPWVVGGWSFAGSMLLGAVVGIAIAGSVGAVLWLFPLLFFEAWFGSLDARGPRAREGPASREAEALVTGAKALPLIGLSWACAPADPVVLRLAWVGGLCATASMAWTWVRHVLRRRFVRRVVDGRESGYAVVETVDGRRLTRHAAEVAPAFRVDASPPAIAVLDEDGLWVDSVAAPAARP